jgi:hypothetical protein
VFQDGPLTAIKPASWPSGEGAFLGPGWRHGTPGKRRLARRRAHAPDVFLPPTEPTLARARASGPGTAAPDLAPEPGSDRERFPFDDFTYCLTLFSKCFSSFDHSTCSLSVSGLCLALEGVYLPLGAAFPNNPTRRRSFVRPPSPTPTGLSPSVASFSKEHGAGTTGRRLLCKLQLRRSPDFKFGLLPLRSPLLRQSLLVSFPPLIDMLKFSGYSRLIRGRTFGWLVVRAAARQAPSLVPAVKRQGPSANGRHVSPRPRGLLRLCGGQKDAAYVFRGRPPFRRTSKPQDRAEARRSWRRSDRRAPRNAGGRNVRSKIQWFAGFCNSHHLSRFAAFFIDARTKRSVVKGFDFKFQVCSVVRTSTRKDAPRPAKQDGRSSLPLAHARLKDRSRWQEFSRSGGPPAEGRDARGGRGRSPFRLRTSGPGRRGNCGFFARVSRARRAGSDGSFPSRLVRSGPRGPPR